MLKIDNNSLAFLVCMEWFVTALQEGEACPVLGDSSGYVCIVKKGVPITIVSSVGEEVTVNITVPGGGEIASSIPVGTTPNTGYTFTTYSNETYIVTK